MPGLDTARAKASRVRLIIFDVDGVLTDGSISYASDGEERKRFHVRDGSAVIRALRRGLKIAWVSGRRATAVERRASELGVADLFQGIEDKRPVFERLRREGGFKKEETAYLG
ncbi:MAG TPA: hypothetical protein PK636_11020, partial [bacterium]|nr:hypothetical protein [bacterium]